jgi:hypothetical protein
MSPVGGPRVTAQNSGRSLSKVTVLASKQPKTSCRFSHASPIAARSADGTAPFPHVVGAASIISPCGTLYGPNLETLRLASEYGHSADTMFFS